MSFRASAHQLTECGSRLLDRSHGASARSGGNTTWEGSLAATPCRVGELCNERTDLRALAVGRLTSLFSRTRVGQIGPTTTPPAQENQTYDNRPGAHLRAAGTTASASGGRRFGALGNGGGGRAAAPRR